MGIVPIIVVMSTKASWMSYVAQSAAAAFNLACREVRQTLEMMILQELALRAEAEAQTHAMRFPVLDPIGENGGIGSRTVMLSIYLATGYVGLLD